MSFIATLEGLEDISSNSFYAHEQDAARRIAVGPVGRSGEERARKELDIRRGNICSSGANLEEAVRKIGRFDELLKRTKDPKKRKTIISARLKFAHIALKNAHTKADSVRLARSAKAKFRAIKLAKFAKKSGNRAVANAANAQLQVAVKIDKLIKTDRANANARRNRAVRTGVSSLSGFDAFSFNVEESASALLDQGEGTLKSTVQGEVDKIMQDAASKDPFGTTTRPKSTTAATTAASTAGVAKPDLTKFKAALTKLRAQKKRPVFKPRLITIKKPSAPKTNTLLVGGGIAALLVAGLLYFR